MKRRIKKEKKKQRPRSLVSRFKKFSSTRQEFDFPDASRSTKHGIHSILSITKWNGGEVARISNDSKYHHGNERKRNRTIPRADINSSRREGHTHIRNWTRFETIFENCDERWKEGTMGGDPSATFLARAYVRVCVCVYPQGKHSRPRVPLQHRRAIKTSRSDGQFSRFTIRR